MGSNDFWLSVGLDTTGLNYVKKRGPSSLAFEGVNGTLVIRVDWTKQAEESDYRPSNDNMLTTGIVAGAFLVELVEASVSIAKSGHGKYSISLHGIPLELSIDAVGAKVNVRLIEHIQYSTREHSADIRCRYFCLSAARLVWCLLPPIIS